MRSAALLIVLLLQAGCGSGTQPDAPLNSLIVVANRGDGTISIIDSNRLEVIDSIALPAGDSESVPGYVVFSEQRDRLYVGDEANHRIVVFSGSTFAPITELPVVDDVFHIWHNDAQLWAVDRANLSVAVFDLDTNTRIASIPIPADIADAGGIPHDVVVDENHAFVSILGIEDAPDVVVRYSTSTMLESGRMTVGEDPHLCLHPITSRIYVACQDSDAVFVFDRDTLVEEDIIDVDGGHGVCIPPHGESLYVTNFAGHEVGEPDQRGPFALFSIDLTLNEVDDSTHASDSAPHNVMSNADGSHLFITHSNGGATVTVYGTSQSGHFPREIQTIDVGVNPFGICRIR